MPTYAPHVRVTFGGVTYEPSGTGSDEIWQCTINAIKPGGIDFDHMAYLASIAPKLGTWFHSSTAHNSANAHLTFIKCNDIDTNGRYASATTSNVIDYSTAASGSDSPIDPPIISVAISWSTAVKRGPGAHGRIYPPNNTLPPAGGLVLGAVGQADLVQAGVTLLGIIRNQGATGVGDLTPCVSSGRNATNTPITGVRVGSVKDVQRRRKDAVQEAYAIAPFV